MLIKNKTNGNVRIGCIDFKAGETKSYPDSLEVPKGFEVVEKAKTKVAVQETEEPKVEDVKPKKKTSKKKSNK